MTDRELLEKAAKAAGMPHVWIPMLNVMMHIIDAGRSETWNPLTDDGDALRLAVKLRLDLLFDGLGIASPCIEVIANTGSESEPFAMEALDGTDHYAATRRAIVRAAAAIGETNHG